MTLLTPFVVLKSPSIFLCDCVSSSYNDFLLQLLPKNSTRGEIAIYLDLDLDLDLESGDLPLSLRGEGLLRLGIARIIMRRISYASCDSVFVMKRFSRLDWLRTVF